MEYRAQSCLCLSYMPWASRGDGDMIMMHEREVVTAALSALERVGGESPIVTDCHGG